MNPLDNLLIFSFSGIVLLLIVAKTRLINWLSPLVHASMLALLLQMTTVLDGKTHIFSAFSVTIFGQHLMWQMNALAWFFALITIGAALLSSLFLAGDWSRHYREQGGSPALLQLVLLFNVVTMLVLLTSADLLSHFISWELVSWAGFWLMALSPSDKARKAAVKYLVYAMFGAMSLLAVLGMVYAQQGSLAFDQITVVFKNASPLWQWVLVILLLTTMGIKMGMLPFHLWQAAAYAQSPGPGAAFLGAITSRMGMFSFAMMVIPFISKTELQQVIAGWSYLNAWNLIAILAALTMVIPTFIALRQHDAKRLLAWHGIGQGGYMLLGLLLYDGLGSAGGLMHIFNHATYQAALFLSVVGVAYRTGTSDLNKLGGLVTRMPLSFLVMLFGIIGLAGLPPMNGFVSKWMVYRALIIEGHPFLFVAAVLATLGTILSVYKLIHNTFLGQLRLEHQPVREVPLTMLVPMLVLSAIVLLTGVMPGLILQPITAVQQNLGLPMVDYHLGGISHPRGGLDMIWISALLAYGLIIGAIIFYFLGGKSKTVHQYDNYAGGHFLSSDVQYHYSNNFYPGLMHLIGNWYQGRFQWFENLLVSVVSFASRILELMYRSRQPAVLMVILVVVALSVLMMQGGKL